MNKAFIMGRLTKDPDMRTTPTQIPVATFTVAVDRRFKDANGNKQTDFIPVIAWRNTAEFVEKYFRKGSKIIVIGAIQTRNYDDKDGKKIYVTEIIADEIHFPESMKHDNGSVQNPNDPDNPIINPAEDTSLPFDL